MFALLFALLFGVTALLAALPADEAAALIAATAAPAALATGVSPGVCPLIHGSCPGVTVQIVNNALLFATQLVPLNEGTRVDFVFAVPGAPPIRLVAAPSAESPGHHLC